MSEILYKIGKDYELVPYEISKVGRKYIYIKWHSIAPDIKIEKISEGRYREVSDYTSDYFYIKTAAENEVKYQKAQQIFRSISLPYYRATPEKVEKFKQELQRILELLA
ncbi:hypothetical protein [Scytonema sp. NUACC26]|uniref:beta barrel domain-containing protein n=1 Tax=Scytonema sp. NUACC26 TaxID=3140176 RepID=UPI0034DC2D65